MARLPTVGGDDGTWGDILNDFLDEEHQADGKHKYDSIIKSGVDASKPAAASANAGQLYFSTDVQGGTLYRSTGSSWVQLARGVSQAPVAHKSAHATGGSDALTPADIGALSDQNTDIFYPEDYGAVGDGKRVADGAIGSGSNQLSSSAAAFVTGDAGKSIVVIGAGVSGGNLSTIISSVSGGVATLAATASTTVSNAHVWFGTNDTTALQSCIDAALAARGKILLGAKVYVVSSPPRTDRGGNSILSIMDTSGSHKSLVIEGGAPDENFGPGYTGQQVQFKSVILTTRAGDNYAGGPSTTLSSQLLNTDNTASLTNASAWPSAGYFICDNEVIAYTGKSGNTLTGLSRGRYNNDTGATHSSGTTVTVSYGPPSVIGGGTIENGTNPRPNDSHTSGAYNGAVYMKNLAVQVPSDPEISGIDAITFGGLVTEDVAIVAGNNIYDGEIPTHPYAMGIRWPSQWGTAVTRNTRTVVFHFYVGHVFHFEDHHVIEMGGAYNCRSMFGFQSDIMGTLFDGLITLYTGSVYPMYLQPAVATSCEFDITGWGPTDGLTDLKREVFFERSVLITEVGDNWGNVSHFKDANNKLQGELVLHEFNGAVAAGNLSGTVSGGQNLRLRSGKDASQNVASASTITLPAYAPVFKITGTTTISSITASYAGRLVTLIFNSTARVDDTGNLKLRGNFSSTANSTLTLISDGTNWFEVSRSFETPKGPAIYYPEDYGAKGDGKQVGDGSISASSNQLSSSAATFTASDVGKSVVVTGAGSSGGNLSTTISSVASGVATLSASASTTVSNAHVWFGTDDTSAIQSCIDAALAENVDATIQFSAKTYVVSSTPRTDRVGNCILSIYDAQGSHKSLTLQGVAPAIQMDAAYLNHTMQPKTIIMTTRSNDTYSVTYGPPSVIGGATREQGAFATYQGINGYTSRSGPMYLKNFAVQIPLNPAIAGIDGLTFGGLECENVSVMAGTGGDATTAPTNAHAFGIRWPARWMNGVSKNKNSAVYQMYAGHVFHFTDHHQCDLGQTFRCVVGFGIQPNADLSPGGYGMVLNYVGMQGTKYSIAGWSPSTGVTDVPFEFFLHKSTIQTEATSVGAFALVAVFQDTNNKIKGEVTLNHWYGFGPGSAANGGAPPIVGAQNLRVKLALDSVPTIASATTLTVPPWTDVAKISGTTNITSVTASYPERRLTLVFTSTASMTDGSNLKLKGDFQAVADDSITLVCDGTNWYEVTRSAKPYRMIHTFTYQGTVSTGTLPSFFFSKIGGQTTNAVKARYKIGSGTNVTFKLKKNGSDWGYGTTASPLTATTTAAETTNTSALADNDEIALEIIGTSGTPADLTVTLVLEHTV